LCSAGFVRQFIDREKAVVVGNSKPFRSGKILNPPARDASLQTPSSLYGDFDENAALSSLKELVASGNQRLDPMLATITDAARQLTGASGAALAMWKEGAMLCRARSGDTAPALGARLSADTGISGECLRTGKVQHCIDIEDDPFVDVEVCRRLGLRSLAVLPIQGRRGINGILEVFSTQPAAFREWHINLLQQLAALAERARASQPHGASSAPPRSPVEAPRRSGLLPASDRVGDVALAFLGTRSRPVALGITGVVAIALLALVIWLGWRAPDETDGKAHAATPTSADAAIVHGNVNGNDGVSVHGAINQPVRKPSPASESIVLSFGEDSAGTAVKLASKPGMVAGNTTAYLARSDLARSDLARSDLAHSDRSPLLAESGGDAIPRKAVGSQMGTQAELRDVSRSDSSSDEATPGAPRSIPVGSTKQSDRSEFFSAKASLPGSSAPVSQGVSGGQLLNQVPPVYPAQALLLRLEGTVTLAATIMEDGTVGNIRAVDGPPVLAESAMNAVKNWRYEPYELDGKPVQNEIRINVNFKFPSEGR
jgi:TonB family protein